MQNAQTIQSMQTIQTKQTTKTMQTTQTPVTPALPGVTVDMATLMRFEHRQQKPKSKPTKLSKQARHGDFRSLFKGKGMAFSEVRQYQPGDDVRTIDWRVTARRGGLPHTKIFEEERERPVYIVVDQRSHLFFGTQRCFKSVLACEIGALLAWQALTVGDRTSHLVIEDHQIRQHRPQAGKRGVLACLQALVQANQSLWQNHQAQQRRPQLNSTRNSVDTVPDFAQVLESVSRLAKPGSYVVLISDFIDFSATSTRARTTASTASHTDGTDKAQHALRKLAEHTHTYGIFLYDLLEAHLPSANRLDFTDGNQAFTIDAANKHTRHQYQTQFMQHVQNTQNMFKRLGIPLLLRGTHQETDLSLLGALHDPKYRQADIELSQQQLTQTARSA